VVNILEEKSKEKDAKNYKIFNLHTVIYKITIDKQSKEYCRMIN